VNTLLRLSARLNRLDVTYYVPCLVFVMAVIWNVATFMQFCVVQGK
jgi:hypothetical protein